LHQKIVVVALSQAIQYPLSESANPGISVIVIDHKYRVSTEIIFSASQVYKCNYQLAVLNARMLCCRPLRPCFKLLENNFSGLMISFALSCLMLKTDLNTFFVQDN
jgi:hypothetical protein